MSKPRKLWSAVTNMNRTKFDSQAAAYRWVHRQADLWNRKMLRSPMITVYVDKRDGQGWQTYERVDLRDFAVTGDTNEQCHCHPSWRSITT